MAHEKIPTIGNFMTRLPLTIPHDASLNEAHQEMRKHQIRHLPVVRGSVVAGLVSMDDLHLLETLEGVDKDQVQVEEAMSEVFYVKEDAEIHVVAAKMAREHLDSAVVLDDEEKVVGIFTVTDALNALLHAYKK